MVCSAIMKRFFLSLLGLSVFVTITIAQPALIPNDPGNNIYSITFTDANQQVISIEFDEVIIDLGDITGWTITVGGSSVGLLGPLFEPSDHSIILFQLASSISYADRNNVYVTYDWASSTAAPKIGGASGEVASFGPVQAFNNLPMECEMWDVSRFDYSLALTEICSPTEVEYTAAYYVHDHYVNSVNYNKLEIIIQTWWGDGTSWGQYGAETSLGKYELTFNHVYPDDPNVCYWNSYMAPGSNTSGWCFGGGLRKNFTYENHATDEEGDASFNMHIDTITVCVGQDFTEAFTDATYFNCNPQTEPDFANDGERRLRFTYGTSFSSEPRIQDILIGGVPLVGELQGPLLRYDSIRSTGIPAPSGWETSDDISHIANLGTDAIGQVFEIMLENWGPCNPYINAFSPAIETYSYIKIVDGPIADAGPDFPICEGDNAPMAGAILRTATAGFWDTSTGDGTWTNATSPGGAEYTPGPNDITNGGAWLRLHASDPASGCPEHVDSMYVTIVEVPAIPTINITDGSTPICFDGTTVELTASGDGLTNSWLWYEDGGLMAGENGNTITLGPAALDHDYTTVAVGAATTFCESDPSAIQNVTIAPLPTVSAGSDADMCTFSPYTLSGTIGGAATSANWTTSGTGTFNNASLLNATYTPSVADIIAGNVTLTLTTNNPPGPCTAVSSSLILTIVEGVTVDAGLPGEVCSSGSYALSGASLSGDYSLITWSTFGDGGFNNTNILNPIYTPGAGDIASGSVVLRIYIDSDAPCGDRSDNLTLTVNQQPTVDAGSNDEICSNGTFIPTDASATSDYTLLTWTTSGDGSFTAGQGSLTPTYDPGSNDISTGSVTLRLTATAAGSCTDVFDEMTLTVTERPSVWAGPNREICSDDTFTPGSATATGDYTSLIWLTDGDGSFIAGQGTLTPTYDPGPNDIINGSVILRLRAFGAGSCSNRTDAMILNITEQAVAEAGNNETICSNSTLTISSATATGDYSSLVWSTSGDGSFAAGQGTVTPTYTPGATDISSGSVVLTITANPQGSCAIDTDNMTLTINPEATVGAGPDQSICALDDVTLAGVIGGGASNATWSGGGGIYNPDNTTLNALYTPSVAERTANSVTLTLTTDDPAGACPAVNNDVIITIGSEPTVATLTGSGNDCQGAVSLLRSVITGGTPPYTLDITGHGIVAGYTSGTDINLGALAPATYNYTLARVTDACGNFITPGINYSITIRPTPTASISGTTTVCQNDASPNITFTNPMALPVTITYNINGAGTTTINVGASTTATLAAPTGTDGSFAYNLESVAYQTGPNCSNVIAGTATVTVRPTPTASISGTTTVCQNDASPNITFTNPMALPVTITYNINGAGTTTINVGASTTATLAAPTGTDGSFAYNLESVAYQTGPNCSNVIAGTATVTVRPTPTASISGTTTVCQNDASPNITFTNPMALPVTITYNINGAGTTTINVGASTTATLAAPTGTDGSFAYNLESVAYQTGPNCSNVIAGTATVIVYPTPILTSTLTPADVCSNAVFNYIPTSGVVGTTFNWTRASIAGITPAGPTAGTDNPGETLRNITSATIPVTYQYTLAANGCNNVQDVIVNIKPEPVITPNQIATECSGNALNYEIQLDNFSYPNVTFTWPLPTLNPIDPGFTGGSARAAASANNIGDTYANTTGLIGEATYTVTPYYDGCQGAPVDVVVQIGAQPVLDPNLDDEACSQVAIGLILQEAAGSIVPDRYEITNVTIAPGLVPDALNNDAPIDGVLANYLSNNNYANRTGVDLDVVFTVIPKFGPSCVGDPVDITITIHPEPVILPGQSPIVCSKEPIDYEVLLLPANTPAGTTYDWPVPVMSDFSGQGTAGTNVAADPAGSIHIGDAIQNYSGGNITATYTITPTSALLCAGVPTDVIVTIQPQPVTTPIVGDDQVCTDEINILYQVDSHPGSTYAWTVPPQVGITTFDFNTNIIIVTAAAVAGSGDITVVETNNLGCAGDPISLTVDVSAPVAPENIVGDPVVCAQSTHIYNVTDRVGSVYSWTIPGGAAFIGDPSASSITLILGNNGGTVSVNETTAAGCVTAHNPFAVTVNPLPTATISNGGSVCQGNDQPLQVSFTGTAPWTFTHALNGVDQAPIATSDNPYTLNVNLAGSYTITSVTDANICTGTGSGTAVVGVYPTPTGNISGTTDICPGESTLITMSFTGTAPFDFTYTDGTTPVTITGHPSVVFTATVSPAVSTTYTLTALSDGNGCTGTLTGAADLTLNVPAVINAVGTDPLCTGDFNGSIDLQILSGTPAYSYQWTGPNGYTANTEDITLLEDGSYDVTVTDGNGCETSTNVVLTDPALLTVSAAVSSSYNGTDISCNGALDGELTATPAGGTGAYSFEWFEDAGLTISTGQTAAIATGLAAGTYYIQLTDINLCTETASATLIEPVALAVTVNVSSSYNGEDISCNTATDGQATALPTGGTGAYTYEWFTDAALTASTGITTQVANGLGAGDYWVRVLDVNSCEIVGTVTLTAPPVVTAVASVSSNYNGSDISCNGLADGSALVMPAGGTGAYFYAWYDDIALTSPIGQTTQTASNLAAGQYWVEVTDVNGCTGTATVTLTEPVVLSTTVAVSSNFSGADISCNGANDGAITATPAGGTGAYSYVWYSNAAMTISIGQTTATAVNLSAGTYYVRVLDVNGCEISGSATLTDPPALTLSITTDSNFNGSDISCNGALDGEVTANVGGGTGIYTYAWYDDAALTSPIGQTTATASGLGAGTYWVEVTDENLCAISGNVTLTEPAIVTVSAIVSSDYNGSDISCFGAADGEVTATPAGGTGVFTYAWYSDAGLTIPIGQTTQTATGLLSGIYWVEVSDVNGCSESTSITLTDPVVLSVSAAVSSDYLGVPISCNGATDGEVTATPAGGTGAYSYVWYDDALLTSPIGQTNFIATGLGAGTYWVEVTDLNGCTASASVILNEPLALSTAVAVSSNYNGFDISCNGAGDGAITATPAGGTGAYSYIWYSNAAMTITIGQTTATAVNLTAGTYYVQVFDDNKCETSGSATLTDPPVLTLNITTDSNFAGSDISCNGALDGQVTANVGGGTGVYTYTWYDDAALTSPIGQTTATASGLGAGTYWVEALDENLCTISASVILTEPAVVTVSAAVTSNYNGSNISCFGAADGEVTATPAGGTGAFTYIWYSDAGLTIPIGQTTQTATGLLAGTYWVEVSDVNGCSESTSVTLTDPVVLSVSAAVTSDYNGEDVSCNGASDGVVEASVAGGTGVYSYVWYDDALLTSPIGQTNYIATGLAAGTYWVEVTDQNGCAESASVTVTEPVALSVVVAVSSNFNGADISCAGAMDGAITAAPAGGTGVYSYIWYSNAAMTISIGQNTATAVNLSAGTYYVRIIDVNGCETSGSATLTDPPTLTLNITTDSNFNGSDISCNGALDGQVTANVGGGTGVYTYAWYDDAALTSPIGQTTATATGLGAGTYWVEVTDENLCTISGSVILTEPNVVTVTAVVSSNHNGSAISCFGATDGEVTATPGGGTGAYTYAWYDDALLTSPIGQTTQTATGLVAGTYWVEVTDANGCSESTSVTLIDPVVLSVTASVSSDYNGEDVSCNGASDGTVLATPAGGTGAYSYVWYADAGLTIPIGQTNPSAIGLGAGTYWVEVTDLNGCTESTSVTVTEPAALSLALSITSNYNGEDISCNGAADGVVDAIVSGGTGTYFYAWFTDAAYTIPLGQFTATAINLIAGDYYLRVTDLNGCEITANITLTEPVALNATETARTDVSCFGGADGSMTVEATAGTGVAPYQYSMNGGATWQASGTFNALPAGIYIVQVQDVNGCFFPVTVTISQPTPLTASTISANNVSCNGLSDGDVNIEATAGSGTAPYQYSIDGGTNWQATGVFAALAAGSYTVTVEDALGCSINIPFDITEPPVLELNPTADVLLNCFGDGTGTGAFYALGGTLPYTFTEVVNTSGATLAPPGFNSQSIFAAGAGIVTIRVTDGNGCQVDATITFTQPAVLTPGTIEADQVVCYGDDPDPVTELTPAAGGPVGGYIYQWQMASNIAGPYINIPGASAIDYDPPTGITSTTFYRREVQAGICTPEYSDTVEVFVNDLPSGLLTGGEAICPGGTSIINVELTTGLGPFEIDIDNHGVVTNYNSDDDIIVSPVATTTYRLLRITDSNGCEVLAPSAYLNGSATITLLEPPAIATEPEYDTICEFGTANFAVSATGAGLSYQWYESRDGTNFNALADTGSYIGTLSSNMNIFNVNRSYDTYEYRVEVTGTCAPLATSVDVQLTVQTAPEILTPPEAINVCENMPAGFGVDAQGTGITYQWMVNEGGPYRTIDISEPEYTGADSDSLTLLSAQLVQNGYRYMIRVSGTCAPVATSEEVIMLVEANPVITAQPASDAICENGATVFTSGASGPVGMVYQWYVDRNDGFGFVALTDDGNHFGTDTEILSVSNATVGMNGWQYQFEVSTACMPERSNIAILTVWDNPIPSITPIGAYPFFPLICGGDVLTLDGTPVGGSGTYTTHEWTGAIGPLSATNTQVVDFMTIVKGQYALAYAVTDSRGCVGSDVLTIENERPTAQFTSDAAPSCGYVEVNFTNTSSAEATSFLWDFDDGSTSPDRDVTHGFDNVSATGEVAYFNILMEAISDNGCRDTARSVIIIYPKVDATFSADPADGCHPLNVTFITAPGAGNYSWDFGDGSTVPSGGYVISHLYENYTTAAVVHTAELTTTSYYGCQDIQTVDITVEPIPAPNFTASPMVQTYPDATVTFTNTTTAGPWTYSWNFGDGNTSTTEDPVHTYTDPGTYMVTFYVNNGDCIDSAGTSIVIHPRVPVAAFDEPPSGCSPLEIQFVNQSQWATSYLWDFGDGYVSTKENPSHTYYDPGEMTVRLQVNGPGGTAYASWTLNIYETPNIAFNYAPDSVFVKDKPVRFFNLTSGATDYKWDFDDYYEDGSAAPLNVSYAYDTSHIYFTEGIKNVKLVAWNEHCIDSLILPTVKVIPAGDVQFPTVFRPNPQGPSGGYVDPNDPNLDPSTANSIFFPGVNKQVDEYHLYIYNRWGELIFQSHDINIGWDGYIRGTLAAQGVYLWKVTLVYKNGSPDSMAGDITLLWKAAQ